MAELTVKEWAWVMRKCAHQQDMLGNVECEL